MSGRGARVERELLLLTPHLSQQHLQIKVRPLRRRLWIMQCLLRRRLRIALCLSCRRWRSHPPRIMSISRHRRIPRQPRIALRSQRRRRRARHLMETGIPQ